MVLAEADAAAGLRQQVLLLWAIGDTGEATGEDGGAATGELAGAASDDVAEWWRIRRGGGDPAVREAWRIVDGLVEVRTRRFLEPTGAGAPAVAGEPGA